MASADPSLIVLTTTAENQRAGCLVGFHAQSSMAPRHYCVWLSKANHTYHASLRATHFAVHFLAEGDIALAERFGTLCGEDIDQVRRRGRLHRPNRGSAVEGMSEPVVARAHRSARRWWRPRVPDHQGDREPYRQTLRTAPRINATHLRPGHDNAERAVDP